MSPDRIIMTRAEAIRRRKEEEQKQREKLVEKKAAIPLLSKTPKQEVKQPAAPLPKPVIAKSMGIPAEKKKPAAVTTSSMRRHFEIATVAPEVKAQAFSKPSAPSISLEMPKFGFGPRVFSFLILVFCVLDLYCMLNYDPFIAHSAEITGNSQVTAQEIQNVLGIADQPAVLLNPDQIQINILGAFPDIASAQVDVNFPGDVSVNVAERAPIAAWQQDGQTVWVDSQGYAFPPHGQVDNLPIVTAAGAPPVIAVDPNQTVGAKPFLSGDLSQAVVSILGVLPQGAKLIYDPQYGIGWDDPQGWKVFFGKSIDNAALKYQVYQSMLAYLGKKNIKPTLVNVEFPNAPFYQAAQ